MPRGDNPNSKKNLRPFNVLTVKERRKMASRAGKKSAEKRAEKKTMKQMLDLLLEKEIENSQGQKASTLEAISVALIKKALLGDTKAYEVIRDTIGQKIKDNETIVNINQPVQVNKADIEEAIKTIHDLK